MTDSHLTRTTARGLSRRSVTRGALWAAPTLVVTSAAPALATSLRKDPGINGRVLNSLTSFRNRTYQLEVNSTVSSPATPDGAPYGLYLYEWNENDTYSNVSITYWINGTQRRPGGRQRDPISWTTLRGHSNAWSGPSRGPSQERADGITCTPYTWTYNVVDFPPTTRPEVDGGLRLWLGHFHVQATFMQTASNSDPDVTYWTQRSITVHPGGDTSESETLTFERRNGKLGPYSGSARGARSIQAETTAEPSDGVVLEAVS